MSDLIAILAQKAYRYEASKSLREITLAAMTDYDRNRHGSNYRSDLFDTPSTDQ